MRLPRSAKRKAWYSRPLFLIDEETKQDEKTGKDVDVTVRTLPYDNQGEGRGYERKPVPRMQDLNHSGRKVETIVLLVIYAVSMKSVITALGISNPANMPFAIPLPNAAESKTKGGAVEEAAGRVGERSPDKVERLQIPRGFIDSRKIANAKTVGIDIDEVLGASREYMIESTRHEFWGEFRPFSYVRFLRLLSTVS